MKRLEVSFDTCCEYSVRTINYHGSTSPVDETALKRAIYHQTGLVPKIIYSVKELPNE